MPGSLDLVIRQGATFNKILRWTSEPLVYKPITGVPQLSPIRLTVVGHGIVDSTRIAMTGVGGATQLNAAATPPRQKDYTKANVIDPNTLELPDLNGYSFGAYTSGGVIQYYSQIDLTGYTAKMQIKGPPTDNPNFNSMRQTDPTVPPPEPILILELSTDNGRIVIDPATQTIELVIEAPDTELLGFTAAFYDLKLMDTDGFVTTLVAGDVTLETEVTSGEPT